MTQLIGHGHGGRCTSFGFSAVAYSLTKRMQEIGGALDKLDGLSHKWAAEDAKAVPKRKAWAV